MKLIDTKSQQEQDRFVEDINEEIKTEIIEEKVSDKKVIISTESPESTPPKIGEKLENAVLALFREFFIIANEKEDEILESLRKQKSGSQNGYDISFECISKNNRKVNCYIECKNKKDTITKDDIAGKLLDIDDSNLLVDHWILISPYSDISNNLKNSLTKWQEEDKFPFEIHIWSPETDVNEFFGLNHEVYNQFYGAIEDENHPGQWSEKKRYEVYKKWRDKLKLNPYYRLHRSWKEYLKAPYLMLLKEETGRVDELETLFNYHVDLRCLDEKRRLLAGTMEDQVRRWLTDGKKDVMLILGEFGDGKTAFTYLLARKLANEFLQNPENGWLPVRFTLSNYKSKDPQSFLESRLKLFNADLLSWGKLKKDNKLLVILDGFDEMTPELDWETIKKNIKDLYACYEELKGTKIIITSRPHFFDSKQSEALLLQRIGNPPVFYLAPIDRPKKIEFLEKSVKSAEQKEVLRNLSKMHDPLGLASKPLFLQMVIATLDTLAGKRTGESTLVEIDEIELYKNYIHQCLERKRKLLDKDTANLDEIIFNLIKMLEEIAIKIQVLKRDYIYLKEEFSEPEEQKIAERLWNLIEPYSDNEVGEKYDIEDDAAARVSVRSILTRIKMDDEKRPVKFCHRSMSEYFVAKGISRALEEDKAKARELLAALPLNPEILHFTTMLMKKDGSRIFEENLLDIVKSERIPGGDGISGGNAITLLFRLKGELPGNDWSGLNLDGANLSGANLSKKNFCKTSMHYAILDNANFEEADFKECDLTGVRLEETSEVLALTARRLDNRIFAAYKDNTIREWKNVLEQGKTGSRVICKNTRGAITWMGIPNDTHICAITNEELIFYDFDDREELIQKARFTIKPEYRRLVIAKDNTLLLLSEREKKEDIINLCDLDQMGIVLSIESENIKFCENFDFYSFVLSGKDSPLQLHRVRDFINPLIPHIDDTTYLCSYTCEEGLKYLLACGRENGEVIVWQINFLNGQLEHKILMHNRIHDGMVSSLAFLDDTRIVSGGVDRKISIYKFDPDSVGIKGKQEAVLQLTIRCKGMRIDGLKGKREYQILKNLIEKATHFS